MAFAGALALSGIASAGDEPLVQPTAASVAAGEGPVEICPLTFEQWRNAIRYGRHETPPWRRAAAPELQARFSPSPWTFLPDWEFISRYYDMVVVDTAICPEHVVRWVSQGIDYGEVVVPIGPLRGEPVKFLVFPIGAPADFVDGYIRRVLPGRRFGFAEGPETLTPEEIEAVAHSAAALTRSDLVTIVEGVAAAIATPTYEAWRDGTDTAGRTVYWDHDEPMEVRAANAATAWEAVTPSRSGETLLMAPYGRYLFAFIDFPTGEWDLFDSYRARWLTEAIEGGDTVFSYVSQPRATNNPPALRFAVIAAGAPPERVEPVLREYLRYYEPLFAENVEKVIRTWRDLVGLP